MTLTSLLIALPLGNASTIFPMPNLLPTSVATPVLLSNVRLLESPFKTAEEADARYLLSLNPDRLLHRFSKFAGMEPKAPEYGGWEKDTISGHSLGHYLSAAALMFASTGDKRFKEKAEYVVGELEAIQKKTGTGYVAGIPDHERLWAEIEKGEIRSQGFDLNGLWVPWYNLHKTFAGLLDAQLYCGDKRALDVARKLADWSIHITRNLNDEQWQKMLACEHGGMNESFAELYARTGEKKYLDLAEKFYHRAILDPLAEGKDILPGKHGNTQIPKILGCARLYELTGNEKYRKIAEFFWDTVVKHHMYAIGGITASEYFGPPDKLSDRLTGHTCEVCKTYNMLKLTWKLFSWRPDAKYIDFAERALYNHILASQNPADGMVCYFTGLMPGSKKDFSTPFDSFWCCVGSGMENHARYGEGIYFEAKDALYVNLYIPSTVEWKSGDLRLRQEQTSPLSTRQTIFIDGRSGMEATIRFRWPKWAGPKPRIREGATLLSQELSDDGFVTVRRVWKGRCQIDVEFPAELREEPILGNERRVAFFMGPWALAADLSELGKPWEPGRMPVILDSKQPQKAELASGHVIAESGRPFTWILRPLYELLKEPYSVYFDRFTEAEWKAEESRYRALEEARLALEKRTIDWFAIGQMQPERDHKLRSENSSAGDFGGRHYRDARRGGYFEFEMKVDPSAKQELICTYWGGDVGRTFDILIDGEKLVTQNLQNSAPGKFFDVVLPLPESLKGKSKVTIRFQALPGGMAGGVFGIRVAKVD